MNGSRLFGSPRLLSDWRARRKACAKTFARVLASSWPDGRDRKREPAGDQQDTPCRRGKRKQRVAGELPQGEVAREQGAACEEAPCGQECKGRADRAARRKRSC